MAKKGYIIETRIAAKNVDAYNRTALCEADLDGGALVELGEMKGDAFTATQVKATGKVGLWMAYNPSEHYTVVDDKYFAGLSADPRDYTNIKNRPLDIFKLQVGDLVGFTAGNIKSSDLGSVVVGDYLEPEAGGQLARKQTSPTEATTSFKVVQVKTIPMPQAKIGMEQVKVFIAECAQN